MFEIMRALRNNTDSSARRGLLGDSRGFSMIEMLMVVAIATILTVIAIPLVRSTVDRYRLQGAVASSTWAIQSTRYQALMEGYPFQVAFSSSTNTYQIQSMAPPATTYSNVGSPVPISGSGAALTADTTLTFKPNGFVTATIGGYTYSITYNGLCQKATVTNYANITMQPIVANGTTGALACP
jgi:prepilin-type N-terminal cleavage/methylation domain-containing protein